MKVRGAPAIAVAAMLGLAAELANQKEGADGYANEAETIATITKKLDYLETSRPTAVNLFNAVRDAKAELEKLKGKGVQGILDGIIKLAEVMFEQDTRDCMAMGEHGCKFIKEKCRTGDDKVRILTHCNAGALATSKYGTALSVMRYVHSEGILEKGYCTETRPYNQGARLTAYELVTEGIQTTLVCDSAVAYLMNSQKLNAVVLGADRVCRNGDTANKIGTYQIALSAKAHGVPFIVVAPSTTFDLNLTDGSKIVIEQRSSQEVTHNPLTGDRVVVDGENFSVWNPAFDVTPANLISAIVTEQGVVEPTVDGDGNKSFDLKVWLEKNSESPAKKQKN
eukprot:TRINITY_DN103203_c0_g1_i1.p1 TRINITY_DN103203_c0_g1~~TRINITY_DN103203_c0_g1_i1.p1  ORF type:complete len:396 (-),score=48.23 TRINITY_DN103203_c0_g1_i1:78-1091(-)